MINIYSGTYNTEWRNYGLKIGDDDELNSHYSTSILTNVKEQIKIIFPDPEDEMYGTVDDYYQIKDTRDCKRLVLDSVKNIHPMFEIDITGFKGYLFFHSNIHDPEKFKKILRKISFKIVKENSINKLIMCMPDLLDDTSMIDFYNGNSIKEVWGLLNEYSLHKINY